jgi:GntR family transcriptional regulator/MocR family aminotransferase
MKISDGPVRRAPELGARSDWELALPARAGGGTALYVQIVQAVVADIRRGRLVAGQHLPGTRTLAERLGVHRNTVLSAYAELTAEGWIESDPARQTRVSEALPDVTAIAARAARRSERSAQTLGFGLDPEPVPSEEPRGLLLSDGTPDLRLLPRVALARAYRRVIRGRDLGVLGYGDPRGHVRLRRALASMLVATRGLRIAAEDVMTTRGSQMALELVSRVLGGPGTVMAIEALGYRPAWRALAAAGAELVPVSVDAEGLVVAELEQLALRRPLLGLTTLGVSLGFFGGPSIRMLSPLSRLPLLALAYMWMAQILCGGAMLAAGLLDHWQLVRTLGRPVAENLS